MIELTYILFLVILALIWLIFASIHDVKTTEVPDWLNFSLIAFALGFRFFYSLFVIGNFNFFFQGLIGLGIFFVLGNLFYYGRMFAGGDAKLMIALGTILPFSFSLIENLKLFGIFIFIFFLIASLFGIFTSVYFAIVNKTRFQKEFVKIYQKNKKISLVILALALVVMILGLISQETLLILLGIFIFLSPLLFVFAKSVDEACMVRLVDSSKLMEGDWLYKSISVGDKKILAKWDGLSKQEIKLLQKHRKSVWIKKGVPFVPVFLISFVIFLILLEFFKVQSLF